MKKYRAKPVVIEAIKVSDVLRQAEKNWEELPECIKEIYEKGDILFSAGEIYIKTLEGKMTANYDDYIIKGVQGELYPCKPDIFEQTYEEVIS